MELLLSIVHSARVIKKKKKKLLNRGQNEEIIGYL